MGCTGPSQLELLGTKQQNASHCQNKAQHISVFKIPQQLLYRRNTVIAPRSRRLQRASPFPPSLSWPFPQEDRGASGNQQLPRFVINETRHWSVFSRLQFVGSLEIAALLNAVNPLNSTALLPQDPSLSVAYRNEKCNPTSGSNESAL